MKAGFVKKIDELGRIVIPKEIRKALNVNCQDDIVFYTEGERIYLAKQEDVCTFCGSKQNITPFLNKFVCSECFKKLTELNH